MADRRPLVLGAGGQQQEIGAGDSVLLPGPPTQPLHPASKKYVDDLTASLTGGGQPILTPTTKTSAYTAAPRDLVLANAAAGAFTVTLPPASGGGMLEVKKVDTSANVVTVAAAGSDTVGSAGAATMPIRLPDQAMVFQANGTNWIIVDGYQSLAALDARYAAAGSGGSGGTDTTGRNARPTFILPRINDWVVQAASAATAVGSADGNLLVGAQFLPAGTYTGVGVHLNNAGSAGSMIRLFAYADDNGRPSTLVVDCGTFNAATANGFRSITTGFSLVVPDGGQTLWVGAVGQGNPSTVPTVFQVNAQAFPYSTPQTPLLWNTASPSFSLNGITGALPADMTTATASYGHPRMCWRRTA